MTVLPDDGLSLAAEFPDATHEQWQRLVEGVLRKSGKEASGEAAEEALSTPLEDGLTTRPLYTAPPDGTAPDTGFPGFAPFVRGGRPEGTTANGWDVRQRLAGTDPARLNEAVLADLENGVTSLWLTVGPGGIPVDGLARALDGVYLDLAPVSLDSGAEYAQAARAFLALCAERGTQPHGGTGEPRRRPPGPRGPYGRSARHGRRRVPGPGSRLRLSRGARPDRGRPAVPRGRPAAPPRSWACPWPPVSPTCVPSPGPA